MKVSSPVLDPKIGRHGSIFGADGKRESYQ